jgi:hypothetical protein
MVTITGLELAADEVESTWVVMTDVDETGVVVTAVVVSEVVVVVIGVVVTDVVVVVLGVVVVVESVVEIVVVVVVLAAKSRQHLETKITYVTHLKFLMHYLKMLKISLSLAKFTIVLPPVLFVAVSVVVELKKDIVALKMPWQCKQAHV